MAIHAATNTPRKASGARLCPDCGSTKILTTEELTGITTTLPDDVDDLFAHNRFYCMACYAVFGGRDA